jgi:hypothetical protein
MKQSKYNNMFDINVGPPPSYLCLNLCCHSDPKQNLLLIIVSILVDFGTALIPNSVCKITAGFKDMVSMESNKIQSNLLHFNL